MIENRDRDREREQLELLIRVDTKTIATAVSDSIRAFARKTLAVNTNKLAALAA